jgi:hypothetical protein
MEVSDTEINKVRKNPLKISFNSFVSYPDKSRIAIKVLRS